jgi:hypothetical protein
MLVDAKQRLSDDIYQRKLDTMKETLTEREVELILSREKIRNERRRERQARDEL